METFVVSDGKKGHLNQSLAFAELLGSNPRVLQMRPLPGTREPLSRLFSPVFPPKKYPRGWLSWVLETSFGAAEPTDCGERPLVISAGTTSAIPALALAARNGGRALHILKPTFVPPRLFDVVVLPQHDVAGEVPRNVLTLPVALGPIGGRSLEESLSEMRRRIGRTLEPERGFIAVLVGGDSAHRRMLPELVLSEVNSVVSFARERSLRILLTTSRRTPAEVEDALIELSARETGLFCFCVWGRSDGYNPVPAFLELADGVMVTEDSVSMASEAILAGHHPLILPLEPIGSSHKLERFHQYLYERKLALPLRAGEDNRLLWESALALERRDREAVYNAIGLPELLRQAREMLGLEVVPRLGHTTGA